jgi:hypothetical protein
MSAAPQTLSEFIHWLGSAPPNTSLAAKDVHELLVKLAGSSPAPDPAQLSGVPEPTWRERLVTAPAETRIGVTELAEAVGRTKSWVYRHTSAKSGAPILPHHKLDGELVFLVGEVRRWLAEQEEVVVPATVTNVLGLRGRGARERPRRPLPPLALNKALCYLVTKVP